MKKSITHLPMSKQEDLYFLIRSIKERIPQTEMIILYGSYATGKYVEYDERVEFGIPTSYMSDYDILVVTSDTMNKKVAHYLDNLESIYSNNTDRQTPVQLINEDIKTLNRQLEEGRYFYTQLKKEGVVLYDSGKYKLARRRKLKYKEIQQQAKEYFEERYNRANNLLKYAMIADKEADFKEVSFFLHQACEHYYNAIILTFTLRNTKQHNLNKLSAAVRRYSKELTQVFPLDTDEGKRLFRLIKVAYIEARYNPEFVVTKEDIDALIPKVELLRDITKRICEQKIEEYGQTQ
ncbi:HEPN domain-containing protein [Dysgonomonas sp.]